MNNGAKRRHRAKFVALAGMREGSGVRPVIGWTYGCAERSELEKQTST